MFDADDMCEVPGEYIFSLDGEIVAQFKKDAIAGYFITRVEDDEEAED